MSDPSADTHAGAGQPGQEELRAAYEAELSRITATDMIAQATVSLLNVGARRLGPPPGAEGQGAPAGDLEQVRDAIDAVRALLEILQRRIPVAELGPLRDALSRLQMAYAREASGAQAGAAPDAAGASPQGTGAEQGAPAQGGPAGEQTGGERRPGPAESSGRLWVPGR